MRSFERNLYLYGFPIFLVLVGGIGAMLIGSATARARGLEPILAPFNHAALVASLAAVAVGLLWGGWNAFRERRGSPSQVTAKCQDCEDKTHLPALRAFCGAKREERNSE